MAAENIGTVTQVMGPVLDIKFEEGQLPDLMNAIEIDNNGTRLVVEVAQHMGDDKVRCIAMSSTDGKIYTYEADIPGDCWFIFAGAIGSWDIVNANRFGPESSEEDQEISADEEVQTQLSTGGKSYKIGGGSYVITFNKETLVFEFATKEAGEPCDVDGNGVIDVADLNIVINVTLGKAVNDKADVTGEGSVDVSDINAVINAMLN